MTKLEFKEWPKISRLFRDCTITEKIDGTNGAVGIVSVESDWEVPDNALTVITNEGDTFAVYAQSRSQIITPKNDNYGFAGWIRDNASSLVSDLGPGLHYGEWWGSGINRGYGLQKGEKRFSLFNTRRWAGDEYSPVGSTPNLLVVPILYEGIFDTYQVRECLDTLRKCGSYANPGFNRPEGIVVYHHAANICMKSTLEKDEEYKSKSK